MSGIRIPTCLLFKCLLYELSLEWKLRLIFSAVIYSTRRIIHVILVTLVFLVLWLNLVFWFSIYSVLQVRSTVPARSLSQCQKYEYRKLVQYSDPHCTVYAHGMRTLIQFNVFFRAVWFNNSYHFKSQYVCYSDENSFVCSPNTGRTVCNGVLSHVKQYWTRVWALNNSISWHLFLPSLLIAFNSV